jgi:hypothetical protein
MCRSVFDLRKPPLWQCKHDCKEKKKENKKKKRKKEKMINLNVIFEENVKKDDRQI